MVCLAFIHSINMGSSQSTRKITLISDEKAGVIKLSESLAYRLRGQIEGQQTAATAAPSSDPAAASEPAPDPYQTPPAPVTPHPVPSSPVATAPLFPEPPSFPFIAPDHVPRAAESPGEAADSATDTVLPPAATSPMVSDFVLTIPEEQTTANQLSSPSQTQPDVDIAVKARPAPSLSQPGGSIPPWSIYAEEAHLMVMRLREEKEQEIKNLNLGWHDKMDAREKEFTKMAKLTEEEVIGALKEVEQLFVRASCSPVCQGQQEAVMQCYQDHPCQTLRCSREVDSFTQCVDLARLQSVMKERVN